MSPNVNSPRTASTSTTATSTTVKVWPAYMIPDEAGRLSSDDVPLVGEIPMKEMSFEFEQELQISCPFCDCPIEAQFYEYRLSTRAEATAVLQINNKICDCPIVSMF